VTSSQNTPNLGALSDLAPELAATLVSVASDIALVIDAEGRIVSIAQGGSQPVTATPDEWVGKSWADTVTSETRGKVDQLLKEAAAKGLSRSRQVNHPSHAGDIPLTYTAVRLGETGPVLAVGRDMRALSALQRQLVETQQAMEREYWRRRRDDARYQLLFQIAYEPIVVVDADTHTVVDINRAAVQLFGINLETLHNRPVTAVFAPDSRSTIEAMLREPHEGSRLSESEVVLHDAKTQVRVALTPFGTDHTMLAMRVRRIEPPTTLAGLADRLAALVNVMPDAIVVTDRNGRIRACNPAFLELVQLPAGQSAVNMDLATWFGRKHGEMETIIGIARREGVARQIITVLRGQHGHLANVEASVAAVPYGQNDFIGFIIRDMSRGTTLPMV
jgi:transcriptional regulator PpsR